MTGSRDLQMVNITLRVLSRPDYHHLPQIYRDLGTDYDERVLPSIVNEVLKSVVAQQEAERARFVVDKALQEKRSVVIKAQGEAQSARLIGAAIRDNPGFIQLRKLEAARDIAGTLAKSTNKLFLDGGSLLLDVKDNSDISLKSYNLTHEA